MKEPLAFRLRPKTLDEVIGQEHLTDQNGILRKCVEKQTVFSMILFGPPGTGKTTLAMVLANELHLPYRLFNAVTSNKKDLEKIFEEAKLFPGMIVIVDEVHRLNKDKQDLLLPYIEDGTITLIGATTSNPYFSINPAIRSRCQLFEVKAVTISDVQKALLRAAQLPDGLNNEYTIDDNVFSTIAHYSNGDIRYALSLLELLSLVASDHHITNDLVKEYAKVPNSSISSGDDGHYDAVSAFQKSIRGSDVDASLYYLARLISAQDMDSIERRLLVIAYEDIGLANPAACARTVNAIDAAKRVGFPEAQIILANAVIDLALSPKSRSAVNAIHEATRLVNTTAYQVPLYLRLTPVGLDQKDAYDYGRPDIWHRIQYLPDEIQDKEFYHPNTNSSYEKQLAQNRANLKQMKRTNQLRKLK
ncbi:MAG: replication-associated recombination protein A [Erysipelotrichaceae bacterium]|nr:replication-associated recombination protein A [Erysipelotrichaceae bacterium]